ncbi:MAG: hypothetical protein M5T61_19985 [Acidimicrobiia bacterium]|nr:hypothetical protein [Acidimicrobiia bacterium]
MTDEVDVQAREGEVAGRSSVEEDLDECRTHQVLRRRGSADEPERETVTNTSSASWPCSELALVTWQEAGELAALLLEVVDRFREHRWLEPPTLNAVPELPGTRTSDQTSPCDRPDA